MEEKKENKCLNSIGCHYCRYKWHSAYIYIYIYINKNKIDKVIKFLGKKEYDHRQKNLSSVKLIKTVENKQTSSMEFRPI
jgi:hypothetical protein